MNPKVTILMSVYNDEKYLKKSIESILMQSYENFEFLIYDDASSDKSRSILTHYSQKDQRIKLIFNKENRGLSFNLAEGVLKAQGSWIARMDADDIAFKERIATQIKFISERNDVDVVGSYVIDIDEHDKELEIRRVPVTHDSISKLIWACPFIHPTVLFRKNAILKAGSYDKNLRRRQDYDLWFRCKAANLNFANIPLPLLYYRSTNEYFKKNDLKVQISQLKMGFKGSYSVKAKPIAYIGISIAFLKGSLPYRIRKPLNKLLNKFDPRKV